LLEASGQKCEIQGLLGSSAHGQVYHASSGGQDCALKWYFAPSATPERRSSLARLVQKGAPNDRFVWPMDIATCEGIAGFGSLVPLREPRFRALADMMSRLVDPTFLTLTTTALELADSFLRLHSLGLCYSDVSFDNIFFDPMTGDVSIGDNENIILDGEETPWTLGTPRFLAPEIIRGESGPSIASDLHALAVILFHMFMVHHPLEGRREREIACLDLGAMKKLYGTDPLFIFDPRHGANRPVAGIHNNATIFWNLYPGYVRDIFIRAFTDGLRNPAARVRESEWGSVLVRMRDQLFYCQTCGAENFIGPEGNLPGSVGEQKCWSCQEVVAPPLRLLVEEHAIALNRDTVLYAHHLDPDRLNDYSEIWAEVVPHPTRPHVWGLKNISTQTWTILPPSGVAVEVAPDRSVSLAPGLTIDFGKVEGAVR
jgi:DNA-binding helix-hairpin-helix protein with protein kinase domain